MPQNSFHLKELISSDQIEKRVAELAQRISEDFATKIEADGKPLVLLGVLKGGFMFLADLARRMSVPVEIEFASMSSYGNGLESSGTVDLRLSPSVDPADRRVLIVEDVIDTGRSLVTLIEHLRSLQPQEVRVCALLDKPEARVVDMPIDYVGFEIPLKFVVGYGLDAAQQYRALDGIYELEMP
ncbi:MAG TPA: hypoxanthine phosphoribosyltransferase [Planctomycetaceae bacterium]|nr:hypoxanthine phosphoribosyltransferase [Planctomycetaceae bacterium]